MVYNKREEFIGVQFCGGCVNGVRSFRTHCDKIVYNMLHSQISQKLEGIKLDCEKFGVDLVQYENEATLSRIIELITRDLSEPYSIYTYRYFIHNWPYLCFMVR